LRVGVFGGAFNPPHLGHLVCAQEVLLKLELERVLWVPVGEPPHRELDDDPGAEARLDMVQLAIAGDERFAVSRVEVDREGPSYTSDTLELLRREAPGDEFFLILGGDQAAALPTWHEPEKVLERATVAAVERVGWSRSALGIKLARLHGAERVRHVDMPVIQVSSTGLRRRVREGRPIRYLVPPEVEEYIGARELYREKVQAGSA
jgi:nicotinate-nucleotide adenylyltransferase